MHYYLILKNYQNYKLTLNANVYVTVSFKLCYHFLLSHVIFPNENECDNDT